MRFRCTSTNKSCLADQPRLLVLPSFTNLSLERLRKAHGLALPLKFHSALAELNFGLGYRWEFKKDVNVRLDYGFGKSGQTGFIFNINEAF